MSRFLLTRENSCTPCDFCDPYRQPKENETVYEWIDRGGWRLSWNDFTFVLKRWYKIPKNEHRLYLGFWENALGKVDYYESRYSL